mmetsp:Transcript_104819/g.321064  ORF Transcript_104819/g.321064 Transcript_104819/m.321064 type:complete len:307 (-) Transcript_104819:6-926(-)
MRSNVSSEADPAYAELFTTSTSNFTHCITSSSGHCCGACGRAKPFCKLSATDDKYVPSMTLPWALACTRVATASCLAPMRGANVRATARNTSSAVWSSTAARSSSNRSTACISRLRQELARPMPASRSSSSMRFNRSSRPARRRASSNRVRAWSTSPSDAKPNTSSLKRCESDRWPMSPRPHFQDTYATKGSRVRGPGISMNSRRKYARNMYSTSQHLLPQMSHVHEPNCPWPRTKGVIFSGSRVKQPPAVRATQLYLALLLFPMGDERNSLRISLLCDSMTSPAFGSVPRDTKRIGGGSAAESPA